MAFSESKMAANTAEIVSENLPMIIMSILYMHWNGNVAPMGVKFGTEERSPPPCQILPPSVQRKGYRTPKTEIFTNI